MDEVVSRLRAFAQQEPFGHKRVLMRTAADMLEGYAVDSGLESEPSFDEVELYIKRRLKNLIGWQWDKLAGPPTREMTETADGPGWREIE